MAASDSCMHLILNYTSNVNRPSFVCAPPFYTTYIVSVAHGQWYAKPSLHPRLTFFCLRHPWPPERVRTLQMVSEARGAETFYFPEGIPSAKEAWIIKVGLHNCTVIESSSKNMNHHDWCIHPKFRAFRIGGRYAHESSNNGKDGHY